MCTHRTVLLFTELVAHIPYTNQCVSSPCAVRLTHPLPRYSPIAWQTHDTLALDTTSTACGHLGADSVDAPASRDAEPRHPIATVPGPRADVPPFQLPDAWTELDNINLVGEFKINISTLEGVSTSIFRD